MSAVVSESRQAAPSQSFEIRAFDAPLGAEVIGLDLSAPIGDADFARIHRAHLDRHVLVFRDQRITPAEQIAFSRRFGPLQIHVLRQFQLPGHPEILRISNILEDGKPIGLGDAGHFWHSDLSYKEKPSLGSMLHAQELPSEGGDTLFANMHSAWDTLPDDLKQEVQGLRAEHTYLAKYAELQAKSPWRPNLTPEQIAEVKPVVHPVVRTHPETGEKIVYVNHTFTSRILDIPQEESDALLKLIYDRVKVPEYQVRFRWTPNAIGIWDNRSTQHYAVGDYWPADRVLERVTVSGDVVTR